MHEPVVHPLFAPGTDPADARVAVRVTDRPNQAFAESQRGERIDVRPRRLLGPDTPVFAMGSCFATNLRDALVARGVPAMPAYEQLDRDPSRVMIGFNSHLFHYDVPSIRQEIERALRGRPQPFEPQPVAPGFEPRHTEGWAPRWHDPERQYLMSSDPEALIDATARLDALIADAVERADVYIFTLGLIETWRDRETGRTVWGAMARDLHGDRSRFELRRLGFEENLEHLSWTVSSILERYPDKHIVLTVSPVPLGRTFSGDDVVTANSYSKSMLRVVAGEVEMAHDQVSYWPSYEISTRDDVYLADGRHVAAYAVRFIIDRFLDAYALDRPDDPGVRDQRR